MSRLAGVVALLLASQLSACAKRTKDIEPLVLAERPFAGSTCSQLVAERAKRANKLIFTGLEQDQLSDDDHIRSMGIPTPMGTLFGQDKEKDIAKLKGELGEIKAELGNRCSSEFH